MDFISNLQDRAKRIRGAFLPESVTNDEVGGLFLDIINFIVNYVGDGGGGSLDKKYWTKEEIKVLEQYLYVLDDKIKAVYADDAGKWEGKKFDDYLNQPVRTFDDVEFNSLLTKLVTAVKVIVTEFGTDNFIPGFAGAGAGIFNRDEVHADKLIARKSIEALALVVQKMFYRGGMNVLSPAGMKISKIEDGDGFWRCYFEDSDGQTNDFTVNAQARCNNFGANLKYYWSLVIAVGSNYIDISKTDKDGSGIPEIGDELVQMGHRTDPNLQWVIIDSSLSADAGRTIYGGVNSFSLEGKAVMRTGVDPLDPSKVGIYVSNGRFENVQIGAGCTGLNNFAEYEDVARDIQSAQAVAEEAKRKAQEAQNFIDNTLPSDLAFLQAQIDGQVESFFHDYTPTLTNAPAISWTTDVEKEKHLNDTFTNTSTGASWRFLKNGNVYSWVEIADTATKEALRLAGQAKDTADSKRRVFVVQPTPPYEIGDLWTQGVSGDLMRCVINRLTGNYTGSDWEKASKYTDDTKANQALERMSKMAADGILTKEEKAKSRQELATLEKEYEALITNADSYSVTYTALTAAKNALVAYLTGTAKINENSDTNIVVNDYATREAAYKIEVQKVSDQISKKVTDGAIGNLQIGGSNLINYLVEDGTSAWQGSAATVTVVNDVIKAQCTGAGQWPRLINASVRSATFDTTKKYTISFKIRSNRAAAVSFGIANMDITNVVMSTYTPVLSTAFIDVKYTFTPSRNITQTGYFYIYAGEVKPAPFDSTSWIEVKDVKLETGEKATGMSRSDFDNEVIAKLQGIAGGQEAVDKIQIGGTNLFDGGAKLHEYKYGLGELYIVSGDLSSVFKAGDDVSLSFKVKGSPTTMTVIAWLLETNNSTANGYQIGRFTGLTSEYARKEFVFKWLAGKKYVGIQFMGGQAGSGANSTTTEIQIEAGNKVTSFKLSQSDQEKLMQDKIDGTQIGAVNLISKKMMFAWNNVAEGIATWGQDASTKEIFLTINESFLYHNISGATACKDVFLGEGNYKANTQYLLQVDWCLPAARAYDGLVFYIYYTDGSYNSLIVDKDQVTKKTDYRISMPGKTIKKIYSSYGASGGTKIYDIGLYIANKPLTQIIPAREDLEGQSNVNLLSNSKFTFGTKGYDPNQSVTFNVVSGILQVRTTQTPSTPGICLPIVNLKTGVYTFKTSIRGVNIPQFVFSVWKGNLVTSVYSKPVLFSNNFAEYKFTFVIPEDGDYRLLIYMSAAAASGSPYGFDVEYSTLTPGFVAPAGWFPAPADTELNTKDSFAVEMGYTSFNDLINKAAEKGKLTVDGLLNANLINVDTLFANQAFITKLKGVEFNFTKGTFGGFTATSELLYSGALLGSGAAGIQMKSSQNDWGFNVHKGDNDYVEMYYRSATNWGIKGVIEGDTVFQLGNNNQVAGWGITTTGFQSKTFSWPTYNRSGSLTEGGAGAKLFPNGAFMFCATETGMLQPSTGLLQAGLITAIADNAMVRGLEIRAQSNGYLKEVYTLILSAKNTYSNPSKLPIALLIEDGSLKLNGAEIYGIRVVGTGGTVSTKGVSVMKVTSTTSGNRLVLGPGDEGQRIEVINDTLGDLFINTARDEQTYNFIKGKSKKSLIFSGTSWYGEADNN